MLHGRAEELDDYVTGPGIQWMYDWNMQYNQNEAIKGTYEVDVRSSTAVLRQHMELINLEKVIAQASQNPDLAKVIKMDEAAKVLVSNMMLPGSKIIRTPEEIAEYEQKMAEQQANNPDPALLKVQIEQQRLELDRQKIELENMRLQFESTHNQQRAVMEFQERQEANDARVLEAQAGVMKEKLERDTAMIQFAARQQLDRDKLVADIQLKETDQAIKQFEIGARAELDAEKIATHRQEMKLKQEMGSGI
jgi:hypothetical protein